MQYHPGAATLTTWLEVYTRPYEGECDVIAYPFSSS